MSISTVSLFCSLQLGMLAIFTYCCNLRDLFTSYEMYKEQSPT